MLSFTGSGSFSSVRDSPSPAVDPVPGHRRAISNRHQDASSAIVIVSLAAFGLDVSVNVAGDDLVRAARLMLVDHGGSLARSLAAARKTEHTKTREAVGRPVPRRRRAMGIPGGRMTVATTIDTGSEPFERPDLTRVKPAHARLMRAYVGALAKASQFGWPIQDQRKDEGSASALVVRWLVGSHIKRNLVALGNIYLQLEQTFTCDDLTPLIHGYLK